MAYFLSFDSGDVFQLTEEGAREFDAKFPIFDERVKLMMRQREEEAAVFISTDGRGVVTVHHSWYRQKDGSGGGSMSEPRFWKEPPPEKDYHIGVDPAEGSDITVVLGLTNTQLSESAMRDLAGYVFPLPTPKHRWWESTYKPGPWKPKDAE